LVIQQGKAQQSKAASKDELLSMIQYGANEVMQSGERLIYYTYVCCFKNNKMTNFFFFFL